MGMEGEERVDVGGLWGEVQWGRGRRGRMVHEEGGGRLVGEKG